MARRQATAEQKAAAELRRKRMRELCKVIGDMTDAERSALAARVSVHTIEGRELSFHNQCMIAFQRGGATVVGGFRQWKQAGRSVRKGEHGLGIWCPRFGEKEEGKDAAVEGFIFGTVFDIAQTETDAERESARAEAREMNAAAEAEMSVEVEAAY